MEKVRCPVGTREKDYLRANAKRENTKGDRKNIGTDQRRRYQTEEA